ncbi:Gfo/Idh/MocA family oxidoreductase [Glutamicibacter halophytocola]|uniref:Gfo/Idh/MocA family oxidoreductase n=1 Tax=Glutamicibacter halophytocola TaxID=1933880 RepID=UPI00321BADEB
MTPAATPDKAIRLGLIGSGWIGRFHAESIVHRVPNAVLAAVADPIEGAAAAVAGPLGGATCYTDATDLINDPQVDGVIIASPASTHTELVIAAAAAGKAVFVEKPMALTIEDANRAIAAAEAAGVPLQVGFNRRFDSDFAAAHEVVAAGGVGTPQLLRSLTRDPGLANPGAVKPWTIFLETLIHDFDTLNWFNSGARPIEVFAFADALVAPEFKDNGLLDTALVSIRYDNGAMASAEANFSAAYGYDIRGEIFGSAGMVSVGDVRDTSLRQFTAQGQLAPTSRQNIDLFHKAYTEELVSFVDAIRTGTVTGARGEDAREALRVALACIESIQSGTAVSLDAHA